MGIRSTLALACAWIFLGGCGGGGGGDPPLPLNSPEETVKVMLERLQMNDLRSFKFCYKPGLRETLTDAHIARAREFIERDNPFAPGKIDWTKAVKGMENGQETMELNIIVKLPSGKNSARRLPFVKIDGKWFIAEVWM